MGGKGRSRTVQVQQPPPDPFAQRQAEIAEQLFASTAGMRGAVGEQIGSLLGGGPISAVPAFAPAVETMEKQFGLGRERMLETIPGRGGALAGALTELETGRAMGRTGMEAGIRESAFEQAGRIGYGTPQMALTGLGGASAALQAGQAGMRNLAAQQAAIEAQRYQSQLGLVGQLGVGAGKYLGGKGRR